MEIDNSELLEILEKMAAEGKLPKVSEETERPRKVERPPEQREVIRLTVDKNCRICMGNGWATWDDYTVPFDQVIIGPGGKDQIVQRSGLCSCIRPAV